MALVLAIDQGTSATKAMVIDDSGRIHGVAEEPVRVHSSPNGAVEVDPNELLRTVFDAGRQALARAGNPIIGAVGLANQGETIVAWSRNSGLPQHNAIVWQDRRSIEICQRLGDQADEIVEITGMQVDPYFVAPKIAWLGKQLEQRADIASDTVTTTSDVWLLHQLCGSFSTDISTASRTLLTDLTTLDWSDRCCEIFGITPQHMPAIHSNDEIIGYTSAFGGRVPVVGTCVDQQAALFAEGCHRVGEMKCTYGTGAFLLANSGSSPRRSNSGLTPCAAWRIGDNTNWCLDGQVYTAGSAISWLQTIGVLNSPQEIDQLCAMASSESRLTFIPALAGLAAPWWQPAAKGRIVGLSMSTSRADIVRATLVGIAAQVALLTRAIASDLNSNTQVLRVDGGLTQSASLLQIQADLAQCPVQPYPSPDATAIGIAEMSMCAIGALSDGENLSSSLEQLEPVEPKMTSDEAESRLENWFKVAEQSIVEGS